MREIRVLYREEWLEIQVLKVQGLSERQIARTLGISRNTVARYLAAAEAPSYKLRQPRPTKFDPFKSYIKRRVAEAHPGWIPAPAHDRQNMAFGGITLAQRLAMAAKHYFRQP